VNTGPPEKRAAPVGYRGSAKCRWNGTTIDIYSRAAQPSSASLRPAFELRPYQREAVEAIIKGFGEFRRQLRVCPTGGGKTIEFAALAGHYQPGKTLIIAHRDELIEQARDKVFRFTGLYPDVEKAQARASLNAPIVVASVQTLCRRATFPPDHFRLVVVDEAHHVLSESFQRVLSGFSGAYVLGVTATPDRSDQKLLSDYFENVAAETTLIDLIKGGYLARIRVKNQNQLGRCSHQGRRL
jgi:superfamily II DNA or RNA helicase